MNADRPGNGSPTDMNSLRQIVLKWLGRRGVVPPTAGELVGHLGQDAAGRAEEVRRILAELEHTGEVVRIKDDRYIRPLEADLVPGRIRMNRQGKGFLQPDIPGMKEITVPEAATGTALHEDRVLVRRDVRPQGRRPESAVAEGAATGQVIRILERARTRLVGTLERSRGFFRVIPDDPRVPHDVYVPEPRDVGRPAQVGDKVVVELREWESRHTNLEGEVVEVLGAPDEEGVDMLSVLRQYQLPLSFPKEVLDEARSHGTEVTDGDLAGRVDCRSHRVITIDPDDAKDFDDAICVEPAGTHRWRVWVHIADVSHYVRPGTGLDREARRRGNSTYLVDRVIPMLPEALSNELCSLKPGVDRLTKCVEFLVGEDGRVQAARFHSAVIHSRRRYTYQEALAVLGRTPVDPIESMLHDAHRLAQKIRRLRFAAGSLELDFPEMKVRLDERGMVSRIERMENDVSHQLIEEYMLLANEAVAARLMSLRRPALHRVHEEPAELRLREYREEVLSHDIPCGNLRQRQEIQRLLHRLSGLSIGPALKIGFLRSLMRARYSVDPLGHYGLAKTRYTHFTSPIRRYADLVVHRALFDPAAAPGSGLREIADHLSATERTSADAERDSRDVKLYAFLGKQLASGSPEPYPALVTELRNFGFFVDVPGLGMNGVVPLSLLEEDFFQLDPGGNRLVGRRTRRVIKVGDSVTVVIAKVDRFKKQVDFRLAPASGRSSTASARGTARRRGPDRTDGARGPRRGARSGAGPARPPTPSTPRGEPRGSRPPPPSPLPRGVEKPKPAQGHGRGRTDAPGTRHGSSRRSEAQRPTSLPVPAPSGPPRTGGPSRPVSRPRREDKDKDKGSPGRSGPKPSPSLPPRTAVRPPAPRKTGSPPPPASSGRPARAGAGAGGPTGSPSASRRRRH